MMRLVLSVLLLCASSAVPVAFAATPGEVQIGETLPEATMLGLNGPPRKLSEFRGKPLLINVWASWCGQRRRPRGEDRPKSIPRASPDAHSIPVRISAYKWPEK